MPNSSIITNAFGEYSEFTCEQFGIKVSGETKHSVSAAVGSIEEGMNAKTVVKKYKGIESKTRTKGDGTGELKISLHINYEVYKKLYGMNVTGLKEGISAYGQNSTHKTFSCTMLVLDEDNLRKLKAYPNCIIKEGKGGKIENGGEEVAEIELTVSVMPDENGNGMYEALYDAVDNTVSSTWMEDFTPALAEIESA